MTVPGSSEFATPTYAGAPVPGAQSRPATLTYAFYGAVVVGVLSVISAILLIADSHSLAVKTTKDVLTSAGLGDTGTLGSEIAKQAIDDAASTLVVRGVMGLLSGLLVLAIALVARNGATWARVVLAVLLVGSLCSNGLAAKDVAPALSKGLDWTAIVLSLVVVVLLFLPASGAYAKSRTGVA